MDIDTPVRANTGINVHDPNDTNTHKITASDIQALYAKISRDVCDWNWDHDPAEMIVIPEPCYPWYGFRQGLLEFAVSLGATGETRNTEKVLNKLREMALRGVRGGREE